MKRFLLFIVPFIFSSWVHAVVVSSVTVKEFYNPELRDGRQYVTVIDTNSVQAGSNVTVVATSSGISISATSGGGGGTSSLEVFNIFDGTESSPTASIGLSNAFRGTVSGSTYTIQINVSSITAQGNTFNGTNQLLQLDANKNFSVAGATYTYGITEASETITGLSPGVMHIVAVSSKVATSLVSMSSETIGAFVSSANVSAALTVTANGSNNTAITLGINGSSVTALGPNPPASSIAAGSLGASVLASSFPVSGVTSGTYGSPTQVSSVTVTSQGIVAGAANVTISISTSNLNATGATTSNFLRGDNTWATPAAGGGGGASTLAVGTGTASNFTTNITSPTAAVSFLGSQFGDATNGTTNFVTLNQSSVTLQGPIVSSITVSGVTSGTYGSATQVSSFTVGGDGRLTGAANVTVSLTNSNLQSGTYSNITGLGTQTQALNMGTFGINSLANPVNPQDSATKTYVDSATYNLSFKDSARLATAVALPANTYLNGVGGVGATLTATGNAALTVDGALVIALDRVLVKNEATSANNGVYIVTATGSGILPYILTRALDYDAPAEMTAGNTLFITSGTANTNTEWIQTSTVGVVGTDAVKFSQFSGSGGTITGVTAGAGLSGGGSSGNVTVSLNYGSTNTWTANQVFTSSTQFQGGVYWNPQLITGNYTVKVNDNVLIASNAANTAITITLSTASFKQELWIFKNDKSTQTCRINAVSGDTIDVTTNTFVMRAPGQKVHLVGDGLTNWVTDALPVNPSYLGNPATTGNGGFGTANKAVWQTFDFPYYGVARSIGYSVGVSSDLGLCEFFVADSAGNKIGTTGSVGTASIALVFSPLTSPVYMGPGNYEVGLACNNTIVNFKMAGSATSNPPMTGSQTSAFPVPSKITLPGPANTTIWSVVVSFYGGPNQ